jgi:hypothetical protein
VAELHELFLAYEAAGRRHERRPLLLQEVNIGSRSTARTDALTRAQLSLALLSLPKSTFEARTRLRQILAESDLWSGDPANALDLSRLALCDIADCDDKDSAGNVSQLGYGRLC